MRAGGSCAVAPVFRVLPSKGKSAVRRQSLNMLIMYPAKEQDPHDWKACRHIEAVLIKDPQKKSLNFDSLSELAIPFRKKWNCCCLPDIRVTAIKKTPKMQQWQRPRVASREGFYVATK